MKPKCSVAIALALLLTVATLHANSFADWLCHLLGLNRAAYASGSVVRSDVTWRGERLFIYSLDSATPSEIWHAAGLHSPTHLADVGVIVLRSAAASDQPPVPPGEIGIWLVPLESRKPTLLVPGEFFETLGVISGKPEILVAGPGGAQAGAASEVRLWRLLPSAPAGKRLIPEEAQITAGDLCRLRGGQVLGQRVIAERHGDSEAYSSDLRVVTLQPSGPVSFKELRLPRDPTRVQGRFHPIWINDNAIAYVETSAF